MKRWLMINFTLLYLQKRFTLTPTPLPKERGFTPLSLRERGRG